MAKTYISIKEASDLENGQGGSANYYSQTFLLGDWNGPVSGYYFLTVPQASHTKEINLTVKVYELVGSNYEEVDVFVQINGSFDVTIRVDANTDNRFEGKILIL